MVYAAETLELAMLELLVHWNHYSLMPEMVWFSIELPEFDTIPAPEYLPTGWNDPMHYHPGTQKFGDQFVMDGNHLFARVPSVIVPTGSNILINPEHELAGEIRIVMQDLDLDPRLVNG